MAALLAINFNPIDWITDAAGSIVGSAAQSILEGIVSWLQDGVTYIAGAIAGQLTELGAMDLGSATSQQMGGEVKWIAMAVAIGSIMVSAVMAALSKGSSFDDTLREIPVTLVLMAGWFGVMTAWTEAITALTSIWTTDALVSGLAGGFKLDVGIASFVRALVALLLIIFLIIFFVELLVLNHMLTFGVIIGQVAIALRPVRPLRGVSGQMIRNLITISLVPVLSVASLSLSLGRFNEAGPLSFGKALGALAGIVVSVLMPMVVAKFLPLGGQASSTGRSLIGAGAQVAATGAMVAAGGAALAGGGLSQFVTAGGGGGAGAGGAGAGGGGAGGGGAGGGGVGGGGVGGGGVGGGGAGGGGGGLASAFMSTVGGSGDGGSSGGISSGGGSSGGGSSGGGPSGGSSSGGGSSGGGSSGGGSGGGGSSGGGSGGAWSGGGGGGSVSGGGGSVSGGGSSVSRAGRGQLAGGRAGLASAVTGGQEQSSSTVAASVVASSVSRLLEQGARE